MNSFFSENEILLLENLILPIKNQCTAVTNQIKNLPNLPFFIQNLTNYLITNKIQQRNYWQLLRNLATENPAVFASIQLVGPFAHLIDNFLLTIFLAIKKNPVKINENQLIEVKISITSKLKDLKFEDFDIYLRNIKMYESLQTGKIEIRSENLEIYHKINSFEGGNDSELVDKVDNSPFLLMKCGQKFIKQNERVTLNYSFYFFPIQCQFAQKCGETDIKVLFHMYYVRRDTNEIKKAFLHIARYIQEDLALIKFFIKQLIQSNNESIQQTQFFVKHLIPVFNRDKLQEVLRKLQAGGEVDNNLLYQFICTVNDQIEVIKRDVSKMDIKSFQFYVYIIIQNKLWHYCDEQLFTRLVSVEEFDYCLQQLILNQSSINFDELSKLSVQTKYYYITLIKDSENLLELGKQMLNIECFNFSKVSQYLLLNLSKANLTQLFQYYLDNFKPSSDQQHHSIDVTKFLFKISQNLNVQTYTFLDVICPTNIIPFVQSAFNTKNIPNILKSVFLIQQLEFFPDSLENTAITAFYLTHSVISRPDTTSSKLLPSETEQIPSTPDYDFDISDINKILPFQISPPSPQILTSQITIQPFFHFLKSLIQLKITNSLLIKFTAYLFSVRSQPTLMFFTQFLQPSTNLKTAVTSAFYKNGFSLRRKSMVAQKVFGLIFTPAELEQFYDKNILQGVDLAGQFAPLKEIVNGLDGGWAQRCSFAGVLAGFSWLKQDVFSCKSVDLTFIFEECGVTGLVAKLIILKHLMVGKGDIQRINEFLLKACNYEVKKWEEWQVVILGCQALVFQNEIRNLRELRGQVENLRWFDRAVVRCWGVELDELQRLIQ